MRRILALPMLGLAFAVLAAGPARAVSDTQSFSVTVDSNLTISAPVAATITHDGTDANQAFTSQSWTVECNDPDGGSVTLAVSAPFVHGTNTTYKADAKLALAISSSDSEASWSVTTAADQTDYANATPDTDAQVVASSTAAGNVTFGLTVTFVQSDHSVLAAGTYSTTVTGTLTAN